MNNSVQTSNVFKTLLQVLISLALFHIVPANAGEDALYGPVAPAGSAFVRVFNASAAEELEASISDLKINEVASMAASEYRFLPAGHYTIQVNSTGVQADLAENKHYTLVVIADGLAKLIEDADFDNRKKALVSFYNLTSEQNLTLKTADGKIPVVTATPSMQRGDRILNAVKLGLSVYSNSNKVGEIAPYVLERGKISSLFALGNSEAPIFVWIEG